MVMGQKDVMAQAVYLAQLEAAKGKCKCRTCEILRRATSRMTADFLQEPPASPGAAAGPETVVLNPEED